MKKLMLTAMTVCCVAFTAGAQDLEKAKVAEAAVEVVSDGTKIGVGQQAPNFVVKMMSGAKVRLADFKGKVILLTFWATWCPPCRAELPHMQSGIVDRFADQDFVFLPISRGQKRDVVAKFLEENGYTFPVALDPDESVFRLYAEKGIPRNIVIGRDGKVVAVKLGYSEELFASLQEDIENALKINN